MIPTHLQSLFWDIKTETFEPARYPRYTILRVLEYGDEKAIAWLRSSFSEPEIRDVIRAERRLSRRSAQFWALVYGISAADVAALQPDRADAGLFPGR